MPTDAVALGRVAGAWGVRGWLRVTPYNDPHDSILTSQPCWWLRGPGICRLFGIEQARVHGEQIVARAHGIDDRERARALEGCEVLVSRAAFPVAAPGEVYWIDLIGCVVCNLAGETLGLVAAVEAFGADPVLQLGVPGEAPGSASARLIPFVPAYVLEVDLAGRRIVADWHRAYWEER